MDGTSNLAIQYDVEAYAPSYTTAPEREHLPAAAPLSMPQQPLIAGGVMSDRTPGTSPADIVRRRVILFTATLLLTALASWEPIRLYAKDGFMPFEVLGLTLFLVPADAQKLWAAMKVTAETEP